MAKDVPYRKRSSFYREAPFWSWNDVMTPRESIRQIEEMAKGGWGGYFMHARIGLDIPYMGKEWMKVVKACVAHAKKTGMCAYLYDENKWPSGFAGGIVPRKSAKYRAKYLMLSENLQEEGENYKYIASFIVQKDAKGLKAISVAPDAKVKGAIVYHLYQYTCGLGDDWFFGTCYVDLLEPATTAAFIKCTHEKYKEAVGKEFGKSVPGMFTDEPQFGFASACPGPSVPWTPSLPKVFRASLGYDIMPHLPSLFLPCGDYRKIRYDFYRTATEMFVSAFMKQIYDWCDENHLAYTGHVNAEDTLASQIECVGATMPFYEYEHIPGMDHLGRQLNNFSIFKQVSSVADQLGKERALSELYGCSGQDFNIKGRKWIADAHFALGINLLNPHLWLYTMRGARKRDYPPTISYQQPHWHKSKRWSDRNAVLSYLLTRGKRVVDTLVIHPVESGWCEVTPLDPKAIAGLDAAFKDTVNTLLAEHIDFHFGDETLMAKHAKVDGKRLAVGKGRYSVVVVPQCMTLRYSTARLLADFAAAGGKVIVVNSRPTFVDASRGGTSVLRQALASAPVATVKTLAKAIRKAVPQPIEITGRNAGKVFYHLRDVGAERLLFVANTDYDNGAELTVSVRGGDKFAGSVALPDDAVTALNAKRRDGALTFNLALAEAGSALVTLGSRPYPAAKKSAGGKATEIALSGKWRIVEMGENALTLDYVWTPTAARDWDGPDYHLFAFEDLKKHGGSAKVRYEFEVETMPQGKVDIAIERPERWKMSVNGNRIASKPKGYFVDTEFKRIDITRFVRQGRNVVEIDGAVTKDFELECIYVVGRFGVYKRDGKFVIGAVPTMTTAEDLSTQGLQFFAGVVDIERQVEVGKLKSASLRLKDLAAGAAEVFVNGRQQSDLLYPPYEVEIKGLRKGKNKIRLRLFSTLRNLLGPHHFTGPEIVWQGPGSFTNRAKWTDDYRFLPFGVKGATLVVR